MDDFRKYWGQEQVKDSFPVSNIEFINEDLYEIVSHLEERGFKVFSKNRYNSEFILEFRRHQPWYGTYRCEIKVNKHQIQWIYESFAGDSTGIEGWGGVKFSGTIENKEQFDVILDCTNIGSRLERWTKITDS